MASSLRNNTAVYQSELRLDTRNWVASKRGQDQEHTPTTVLLTTDDKTNFCVGQKSIEIVIYLTVSQCVHLLSDTDE